VMARLSGSRSRPLASARMANGASCCGKNPHLAKAVRTAATPTCSFCWPPCKTLASGTCSWNPPSCSPGSRRCRGPIRERGSEMSEVFYFKRKGVDSWAVISGEEALHTYRTDVNWEPISREQFDLEVAQPPFNV